MEDYILREINSIGELIAALMAKIGLMRQSASPEQIRTTAKTELAETLDIVPTQEQIDTYSSYPDTYGENYCTMVALMDAVTDTLTESAVVS